MKLAFHIGARGTFFSKAICWFTRSKYSHVELVFDNITSTQGMLCFSSDEQDGGTRWKWIDFQYDSSWELVDIPCTGYATELAEVYADLHNNLSYDWLGIFGFVLPWGEHDDKDRFCSEIVTEILEFVLGWNLGKPWMVSPGELYTEVHKYV